MRYKVTKKGGVMLHVPGNNVEEQKDTRPSPVDKEFKEKRKNVHRRKPKIANSVGMKLA